MRILVKLLVTGTLAAVCGCVPSLRGIANDENVIFDKELIGSWFDEECGDCWRFTETAKDSYRLEIIEKNGDKGRFKAKLVKVKEVQFLDLFPEDLESENIDFQKIHFIPVHTFMLFDRKSDKLKLSIMDNDQTLNFLEEDPNTIKFEKFDEGFVLTDSKKKICQFLLKQYRNENIFKETIELKKEYSLISTGHLQKIRAFYTLKGKKCLRGKI